ncbi:hypothetical protein Trydic_g23780 [Trypoxylus dichotomus]
MERRPLQVFYMTDLGVDGLTITLASSNPTLERKPPLVDIHRISKPYECPLCRHQETITMIIVSDETSESFTPHIVTEKRDKSDNFFGFEIYGRISNLYFECFSAGDIDKYETPSAKTSYQTQQRYLLGPERSLFCGLDTSAARKGNFTAATQGLLLRRVFAQLVSHGAGPCVVGRQPTALKRQVPIKLSSTFLNYPPLRDYSAPHAFTCSADDQLFGSGNQKEEDMERESGLLEQPRRQSAAGETVPHPGGERESLGRDDDRREDRLEKLTPGKKGLFL